MRATAAASDANLYRVRRRDALLAHRDDVLSVRALRHDGALWTCYNRDRFAVDVDIVGEGHARYCLMTAISGAVDLVRGPSGRGRAHGHEGMIFRGLPGTRFETTDGAARLALWIDAGRLEQALQSQLGEPPREMLTFAPRIDWTSGPARAVGRLIDHLVEELRDQRGLTTDPAALETFTDLFLRTILKRLEHNYTTRLERPAGTAIPAHLRRAEAFMHAHAHQRITMSDVAKAAGCGEATLYTAFRQFRDTTPLSSLLRIRLRRVREALCHESGDVPVQAIARRFGFTNPSRFVASYRRQFGQDPGDVRRRD